MAHKQQIQFIKHVRSLYPECFKYATVYDVGSMDINGNNKRFFSRCNYKGIDLIPGKNVDLIGRAHEVLPGMKQANTIISTEALEHDATYGKTLSAMYNALLPGGLLVITCAGDGREEHGTIGHDAWCSPATNNYYKNVSNKMFAEALPAKYFSLYFLRQYKTDLQFYAIK